MVVLLPLDLLYRRCLLVNFLAKQVESVTRAKQVSGKELGRGVSEKREERLVDDPLKPYLWIRLPEGESRFFFYF